MWDLLNSLFICMVSVFCGIKPNMIGFIFFPVAVSRCGHWYQCVRYSCLIIKLMEFSAVSNNGLLAYVSVSHFSTSFFQSPWFARWNHILLLHFPISTGYFPKLPDFQDGIIFCCFIFPYPQVVPLNLIWLNFALSAAARCANTNVTMILPVPLHKRYDAHSN